MILISRPDSRGSKKSGGLAARNRTLIPELLQNRSLWKCRSLASQTAAWRGNSLKGIPGKMKYQGATKWQGWGLSQGCLAPPEPWLMSSCLRNCCTQSQGPDIINGMFQLVWRCSESSEDMASFLTGKKDVWQSSHSSFSIAPCTVPFTSDVPFIPGKGEEMLSQPITSWVCSTNPLN